MRFSYLSKGYSTMNCSFDGIYLPRDRTTQHSSRRGHVYLWSSPAFQTLFYINYAKTHDFWKRVGNQKLRSHTRPKIEPLSRGGGHAGVAGSRSDKYANEDLEVDGQQVSFHSPSIIKPSTSSSLISNSLDNSSNDISLCLWTRETKVRVRIFVMFLSWFKPYGNKKEKNNKQWTLKSKFFLLTI